MRKPPAPSRDVLFENSRSEDALTGVGTDHAPSRAGDLRDWGRASRRISRHGLTLIELLAVVAIVGILIALTLPAVSSAREASRRMQCANHFRQMGIGLHAYYNSFNTFPSGHVADLAPGLDGGSWGWGALLLPFVEQQPLARQLNTTGRSFDDIVMDPASSGFLRKNVSLYRCPSDPGDGRSHRFRSIIVPSSLAQASSAQGGSPNITASTSSVSPLAHVRRPRWRRRPRRRNTPEPRRPNTPEPPTIEEVPVAVTIGKSNYVGSFGSQWKSQRTDWNDRDFRGNGLFGRNSDVKYSAIVDGTSNTLALGERCMRNYAAVWAGGDSWEGCGFADNQMVLGTAFYPINDAPISQNIDCDGRGSANFSSYHSGGANFLFADGSVRLLTQHIDGDVFGNLAQRDDGEGIGEL